MADVEQEQQEQRNDSPTPTSRYVNGPRSSTPRKTLPACASGASGRRRRRRCSQMDEGSDQQPTLRVHWADSNDHLNHGGSQPENLYTATNAPVQSGRWPDNRDTSVWDSDTPSLEIGQSKMASVASAGNKKVALGVGGRPRGLRMGVGVGGDRAGQSFYPLPLPPMVVPVAPLAPLTSSNYLCNATGDAAPFIHHPQPAHPYGLR